MAAQALLFQELHGQPHVDQIVLSIVLISPTTPVDEVLVKWSHDDHVRLVKVALAFKAFVNRGRGCSRVLRILTDLLKYTDSIATFSSFDGVRELLGHHDQSFLMVCTADLFSMVWVHPRI